MKKRFIQILGTLLIYILHRLLSAHPFWSTSWKHSRPKRWLSIKFYKPLIFKAPDFNHYATLRYRWYNRRLFLRNEATTTHYFIPLRSSLATVWSTVTCSLYHDQRKTVAHERDRLVSSALLLDIVLLKQAFSVSTDRLTTSCAKNICARTSRLDDASNHIPQRIHLLHSLQILRSANFVQE